MTLNLKNKVKCSIRLRTKRFIPLDCCKTRQLLFYPVTLYTQDPKYVGGRNFGAGVGNTSHTGFYSCSKKKNKKKQCQLWNTCLYFRHSVQHCIFTLLQSRSKGLESMKKFQRLFFCSESILKHKIRGIFLVIYLKSSLQRRPAKISFTFMKVHVIPFSNSHKAREP